MKFKKDRRRKKERTTPQIAYSLDITFGSLINQLSKEQKQILFECITGRSGADVYQNINDHKNLTKDDRTKIEIELSEIIKKIRSK